MTLYYETGAIVPADHAAKAVMGKSGTVGATHHRAPCARCGGAGGWHGWPGFTCYRCGGRGSQSFETVTTKVYTAAGLERLRDARKRAAARAAAKVAAKAAKAQREFDSWLSAQTPTMRQGLDRLAAYEGSNEFLGDLRGRLERLETLTDRQTCAAVEALDREAEDAAARPLPLFEGRVEIEGEVLTTKIQGTMYGSTLKMLVKHADEWLKEHTDGTWHGQALVVEPRYLDDLLAGLLGDLDPTTEDPTS